MNAFSNCTQHGYRTNDFVHNANSCEGCLNYTSVTLTRNLRGFSIGCLGQNWSKKNPQGRGFYLTKHGPTIYFLDPDHAPKTFWTPRKSQEKSHFCFLVESQIIKVGWWGVGSRAWLSLLKVSAHHHFWGPRKRSGIFRKMEHIPFIFSKQTLIFREQRAFV